MDMKLDPSDVLDTRIDSTNRLFWGTIMFNTPHAGAYMAVRQDELSRLGSELGSKLANNFVTTTTGNLALEHPLFKNQIIQVGSTINDVIDQIHQDSLIDGIFNLIAADSRDPISKQFGPESSYLIDTMNQFINPQMPKGLFYGVEEDPVMWRLLHFMSNDPADMPAFSANEDEALIETIEEIRIKMLMQAILSEAQANVYASKMQSNWNFSFIFPPAIIITFLNNLQKWVIADNVASSNNEAADMLSKSNMLYKTILGSIDDSYVTVDTIGYNCKKVISVTANILGITLGPVFFHHYETITNPQQCDNTLPSTFNTNILGLTLTINPVFYSFLTYEVICTELTVITEETIYEIPSDATVLKPSQMAFPGCLDKHKRLLNERFNSTTGQFETIAVPKVNHLQVRNCEETEAAMRRLYEADGNIMPEFFKLEKK